MLQAGMAPGSNVARTVEAEADAAVHTGIDSQVAGSLQQTAGARYTAELARWAPAVVAVPSHAVDTADSSQREALEHSRIAALARLASMAVAVAVDVDIGVDVGVVVAVVGDVVGVFEVG